MRQTPKYFLASVAAAMATIIFPVAIVLYVYFQGSPILEDGTPDNAPFRAAGILLFLIPIIFVIILAGWYSITKGLSYFNALKRQYLLIICLVFSFTIGGLFAIEGYKSFGVNGAFISFINFFIYTFVSLGLGWLVWWPIGFSGHNKANSADAKSCAAD